MKAREYFEQASEAARDMDRAELLLSNLKSREGLQAVRYDKSGTAGTPDSMSATDSRIDFESFVVERIENNQRVIDDALVILYGADGRHGLSKELGTMYADVLCAHCLQLQTWATIAAQWNCSDRYCRMLEQKAYDYIDDVGFAHLRNS